MTPVTSPYNQSSVMPSPSVDPSAEEDNSTGDISEIGDHNCDQLEGCGKDKSNSQEYMETDGIHNQNL